MVLMLAILAKAVVKVVGEGSSSSITRPVSGAINETKTNLMASREGLPRTKNNKTVTLVTRLSRLTLLWPLKLRRSHEQPLVGLKAHERLAEGLEEFLILFFVV